MSWVVALVWQPLPPFAGLRIETWGYAGLPHPGWHLIGASGTVPCTAGTADYHTKFSRLLDQAEAEAVERGWPCGVDLVAVSRLVEMPLYDGASIIRARRLANSIEGPRGVRLFTVDLARTAILAARLGRDVLIQFLETHGFLPADGPSRARDS